MNLIPDFNAKVLCEAVEIRISKWIVDSIRFGADSSWNLIDSVGSLDAGGFWWIRMDPGGFWFGFCNGFWCGFKWILVGVCGFW